MRIPDLGSRGEGWVAGQLVLLLAIAASGALSLSHPWLGGVLRWMAAALGAALIVIGAALALRGLADLGTNLTPVPYPRPGSRLVEGGVYRHLRHPIYAGIVAGSLGWGLLAATPLTVALALVLGGWFDLKSRREEAWLRERYPGYAAYAARTRRFVPRIY